MAANRIRVSGGSADDRKSSILKLANEYEKSGLFEEKKTQTQSLHTQENFMERKTVQNIFAAPQKPDYKKFKCTGGCTCTPLGWNDTLPQ